MYAAFLKRCIDIIVSCVLLLLTIPLLLVVSIVLIVEYRGVFLFLQERAGINGEAFTIYKFKTLPNILKEGSQRKSVSVFGAFLRASSIDELPQLINVLKGNMGLVGPRPLYMKYNALYSKEHIKRLTIRPGITGLAQIKGGNSLTWREKFDFDVIYVDKVSFSLDMVILFKTFLIKLMKNGVTSQHHLDVEEFTGYNNY